jgi:nucleoside-triphosphatase THEP1
MQASADNQADIYIYDEIGYWGVTAKQFVNDLQALGLTTLTFIKIRPVAMSSTASPFLMP